MSFRGRGYGNYGQFSNRGGRGQFPMNRGGNSGGYAQRPAAPTTTNKQQSEFGVQRGLKNGDYNQYEVTLGYDKVTIIQVLNDQFR